MSKEICEICGSSNCVFDQEFGFWKCLRCKYVWAYSKDDPDNHEDHTCEACGGLGLNTKSLFISQCPSCDGTGYKPDIN